MGLGWLFPKRCVGCGREGGYFCESCRKGIQETEGFICPMCRRGSIGGNAHPRCKTAWGMDGLVSLWRYDGAIRQGIKALKFRWVQDICEELMALVEGRLGQLEWWREYVQSKGLMVVPVPLHAQRERWRGFNQAEMLADGIGRILGLRVARDLLVRRKETASQAELKGANREEIFKHRQENIEGAFKINFQSSIFQQLQLTGVNILLVDDVWTSGATMRECGMTLKRVGVGEVWGLTLAR